MVDSQPTRYIKNTHIAEPKLEVRNTATKSMPKHELSTGSLRLHESAHNHV